MKLIELFQINVFKEQILKRINIFVRLVFKNINKVIKEYESISAINKNSRITRNPSNRSIKFYW